MVLSTFALSKARSLKEAAAASFANFKLLQGNSDLVVEQCCGMELRCVQEASEE